MDKKVNKKQSKSNKNYKIELKNLPHWVPYVIFALTTIVFFWDILMQNAFFWEDFIEYVFPVQTFAAVQSANGIIPFWNPFSYMGMPFLADLQVGFFYPLNRLLTLFVSDGSLPVWTIEFIIILHFFIAQIGMYYLVRYFKVSSYGALISAVSYSFSMLLVCHVIHPMIVYHLAWLPMILLYFVRGIETRKLTQSILAGIILGFVILSGHPQFLLYIVLLLAIIFIWLFIASIKNNEVQGSALINLIAAGILPVLIGIGIFMIQYLPSQELAKQSQRSEITYEKSTEGALAFKNVYTAVVPDIFGSTNSNRKEQSTYYNKLNGQFQVYFFWETAFYFGITALLLGLFAAIRLYKTRHGAMLIFIAVFGFLFALGSSGLIFDIMYQLPFFGTFRNPGRMMFFAILAFSILAGFGFDELWKNRGDEKIKWQLLLVGVFPLLISIFTATGTLPAILGAPEAVIGDISTSGGIALLFTILVIATAYVVNRKNFNPSVAGWVLIFIAFIDLMIAGAAFNKGNNNPEDIYRLQPQLRQMFVPKSSNDLFRVNTRVYKPVSFSAMQRNQGMISRIHQVEGYNPLVLKKAAIYAVDEETSFDLSNVKYQIKVDVKNGSWNYVERQTFMPRARMLYSAIIKSKDEVVDFMKKSELNISNVVVLNSMPAVKLSDKPSELVKHKVKITSYKSNIFKLDVSTAEPGILVLSEIWYPDWKAYVDGKEVAVLQAYNSFRAIEIPAGHHKVKFEYVSSAFTTGSIISVLTMILALGGFFIFRKIEK